MAFILLINASEATDAIRTALKEAGPLTEFQDGNYLRVGSPSDKADGWLGIIEDSNTENDYDPNVISKLAAELGPLKFFIVEGRNGRRRFAKILIENFPGKVKAAIDDTRGNIVSMDAAKKMVEKDHHWLVLSD